MWIGIYTYPAVPAAALSESLPKFAIQTLDRLVAKRLRN